MNLKRSRSATEGFWYIRPTVTCGRSLLQGFLLQDFLLQELLLQGLLLQGLLLKELGAAPLSPAHSNFPCAIRP